MLYTTPFSRMANWILDRPSAEQRWFIGMSPGLATHCCIIALLPIMCSRCFTMFSVYPVRISGFSWNGCQCNSSWNDIPRALRFYAAFSIERLPTQHHGQATSENTSTTILLAEFVNAAADEDAVEDIVKLVY